MPEPTNAPPTAQEVIKKGQEIYETKKSEFESTHNGQYITIEVNSGDYFIGNTREDAVAVARVKYPTPILYVRRIGAIEKVARHAPNYWRNNKYARIL